MSRVDQWLRRGAAAHPGKLALFAPRERLTYAALDLAVDALALSLRERGVKPGMALAGFFEKRPSMPIVFLAASRLGAIFAPLSARRSPAALGPILRALDVGAFFCELGHLPALLTVKHLIRPDATFAILRGDPPARGYARFPELLETRGTAPDLPDRDAPELVYLNFTSGTTGEPKAAVTTQRNLEAATRGACDGLGLTPADVHLCLFAPDAHPHEVFARALYLGGTAVLLDSMSPKALANAIEKARVTCAMAVPPLYEVSLKPQLLARTYRLESLRLLEAGGMATPAPMIEEFRDRFGMTIRPVWGSTETTGIALAGSGDGTLSPLPGFGVELRGEEGSPAKPGDAGELCIRGDAVVSGYLGVQSDPAIRDGVLATGDVARPSGGGIQILGRRDDMAKVGGLKVFPQEIEGHLRALAGIADAAVVFREERARGVAPHALVVLKDGAQAPGIADVRRLLRAMLPAGILPRSVEVVAALPRTPAGKLDRKALC